MSVEIQWLNHASFRLTSDNTVVYIDPWKLSPAQSDADVVFVSHGHFDHFSAEDVAAVSKDTTVVFTTPDVVEQMPTARLLKPGERAEAAGVTLEGVPAYNVDKDFHPRANGWLGVVITLGGARVYYAGDTDLIPEMSELSDIDVALLPAGGTYTMTAAQAVEACQAIRARVVVPYHWGDIVGSDADAEAFVAAASGSDARLIRPGESFTV
jgi:L-ascorbate metabolism protein UlaG (beta-lactamase superfamily)